MDKQDRTAILLVLADQLRKEESWCDETHMQKTAYVMQELLQVPLSINFILYKHGPFSFDLQDELSQLRGEELLAIVPTDYQSSLKPTELGMRIAQRSKLLVDKHLAEIQFVAKRLGKRRVSDLEKVATALYVTKEIGAHKSVEERAAKLISYKPHIKTEEAVAAINEIDSLSQARG